MLVIQNQVIKVYVYISTYAIDEEGRLVSIAFAIYSVENSDNWMWFCEYLYMFLSIINTNETVIISDHKKGILDTVYTKLPNSFYAHYMWHIEKNINMKFRTKLGDKIWAAAKALHIKDFNDIMKKISNMHSEAIIYLQEISPAT
ncbi:15823_t:CDS:2 [Dentiscutata erythropus]|uniref:15823_t:CDS:1 n=1 Tax=Dentiscutata erythropus TaxID=1348616 RepID=A0A9N9IMJ7_9GLOM|nr:15823_t:CDS:2 [Dentiscutata erythropus]